MTNMQLFQPNLVNKACNIWSYELHQPKLTNFPFIQMALFLEKWSNVSVFHLRHSVLNYYAITMKHSISSPNSLFD